MEFTCWNGNVIRLAFIIDAFDRESIAWTAVANAGISGSNVRDMMLEAVEKQFSATRAPHAIEHLSDNGSAYTARDNPALRPGAQFDALLHAGRQSAMIKGDLYNRGGTVDLYGWVLSVNMNALQAKVLLLIVEDDQL